MHKASDCEGPNKAGATYYMGLVCTDGSEIAPTNKSAGNVGEDCDTGDGTVAISPVPFYNLHTALGLTAQESLCLNDKCAVKNNINSYLRRNINTDGKYDADALSFASAVAKTLVENSCNDDFEVDWDDKIINNLTGTALCVYNKLAKTNLTEIGIIQNTYIAFNKDLNFKEYYLTYSLDKITRNINGETKKNSSISYEIVLNNRFINNRAPIEIARTILHESIHALLLKHGYGPGTSSFVDLFKNYLLETTGNNDLHHAIMRDKYIIPIAKGLQNYDNNAEEFSYYENLAYFGLHQNLTDEQLEELRKAQIIARSKGLNCVE